jgi:hypothetical protein
VRSDIERAKRLALPVEVGDAMAFLASDQAAYITGRTLVLDGGQTLPEARFTARRIAQPPKAAFVTRLQPFQLPGRAARQLPDQSTTLWVEPSSTSDPRLGGALPNAEVTDCQSGDTVPGRFRAGPQMDHGWLPGNLQPARCRDL